MAENTSTQTPSLSQAFATARFVDALYPLQAFKEMLLDMAEPDTARLTAGDVGVVLEALLLAAPLRFKELIAGKPTATPCDVEEVAHA